MGEAVGRAGGNVRHLRHQGSAKKGTPGSTRADRRDLLREAHRDLDMAEAEYFASKPKSSIVLDDTHLNVSRVNDGAGGFRKPQSIDEILDYGDARIGTSQNPKGEDRIGDTGRKWNAKSFETTLIAAHLPKTMCREIPNYYPVLDKDTGEPVLDANDEPMMRSRWVAKDRAKAIEYFERVVLAHYAEEVLSGGHDAIHGYNINFDESTPHIQIMADTLASDPKHPGELRCEASQMWGSHRDVTTVRADKDGVVREMMEPPKHKMSRYQRGLRDRAIALRYPVEKDYDEARHLSGSGNDEYGEMMDAQRIADEMVDYVEERAEGLDAREQAVEQAEAELPELRRRAREEGRQEGIEQAHAEWQADADHGRPAEVARLRQHLRDEREKDARKLAAQVSEAAVAQRAFEQGIAELDELRDAPLKVFGAEMTVGQRLDRIARQTRNAIRAAGDAPSATAAMVNKTGGTGSGEDGQDF